MIKNPVLAGFHPDPSIICVDGTFYIANSTFEYFPGVKISWSRDLANWETVPYPLDSTEMLNMWGIPKSAGIWAPCLSYCDGIYYLVFTVVRDWADGPFKDTPNYITTAPSIEGPWTKPIFVNCSGFDPSLFHDDDGRKYFVNMEWDYRKAGDAQFSGILITELDRKTLQPVSEPKKVFKGSARGLVEGPHIYKKDGYYFLLTAEGGTTINHAETVARASSIYGQYEMHPNTHLMSCKDAPNAYIQKAGHGSICQSPDGRWWTAFLSGRHLPGALNCPLGRETSINEVIWENGWPYLRNKTLVPDTEFEGYGENKAKGTIEYDFNGKQFKLDFMNLRIPPKYELLDNGVLRLYGGDSPQSCFAQNMFVRRQTDFSFTAETLVELPFEHFQRMAGMIYRYDEQNQYLLRLAYDEEKRCKCIGLLCFDHGEFTMPLGKNEIPITGGDVHMKLSVNNDKGTFSYSQDGIQWTDIPYTIEVSKLSDEYATPMGFTGAFIGMSSIDVVDGHGYAGFKRFVYSPG